MPDGRQRWRDDAIDEFVATEHAEVLFVAGYEENQVIFHPRFALAQLLYWRPVPGFAPTVATFAASARQMDEMRAGLAEAARAGLLHPEPPPPGRSGCSPSCSAA